MKNFNYIAALLFGGFILLNSCVNDLDTIPLDENVITSVTIYEDPSAYRSVLAKIYGGLSLTGQVGPDGDQDVLGIDEGTSSYLRTYWYMQDGTTEMALWIWNDPGIPELQTNSWTPSNEINMGMYSRIFYQITLANEFIRESAPGRLQDRGFNQTQQNEIALYRAEARFLRALSYYHAMDFYRSVPFVTEDDLVGAFLPDQISTQGLFDYIESELLELEDLLVDPLQNVYGRVDKAAVWMLLAKLYLNAEVYIGTAKYTETITYSQKVIDSPYELESNYERLFMADNDQAKGIIFPVVADGINAQTWGGVTMIACSAWASDMNPAAFGIDAWGGNRARRQLIEKFPDYSGETDQRAMFYTQDRIMSAEVIAEFNNGFSVMKYKNININGIPGSNIQHLDIDFPLFRIADAYLMLAEAVLRGGSGASSSDALAAVNAIRDRAFGDESGRILASELTLEFILDERAREFYWEAYRRTDLVRFGKYTSADYLWEWKGGIYEGRELPNHFNWFPIPASDMAANPNLRQSGY
ncbi:RagB/SusD family nutrient uptake outer membrane protein [Natronoflexus pectinivorans]|uniref:Putative outer membrane starch-binding protein n=1 Tax=Natronoflexus pectinivorans TaxID=682526 RepID=A0A4R2GHC6_9BACT|nr:RagB/SusD family nutrient uptake outer membrane protein [Natronoflexus pectinivorans]TCO07200.1 putative outer membrane starch-binding protein [Natronoflexus pectinivorans]